MQLRELVLALLVLAPPAHAADARTLDGRTPDAPSWTRVFVYDFDMPGFDARQARVVMGSFLAELRKHEHLVIVGAEELRAIVEHEANRQLLECTDNSCLAEIAEAVGADTIVVGNVAIVGDSRVLNVRRLDVAHASVKAQVNRRLVQGNGEELLGIMGTTVAELFPEQPLRAGAEQGVALERVKRLNPPPVPAWVTTSTGITAASLLGGGALLGIFALGMHGALQERVDVSAAEPMHGRDLQKQQAAVDGTASAGAVAATLGAIAAIVTGGLALVTDFAGEPDDVVVP